MSYPAVPTPSSSAAATRPSIQTTPAANLRSLLLKLPNAKASRLDASTEQWIFVSLGDFAVYQVARGATPAGGVGATGRQGPPSPSSPASPSGLAPPPMPARSLSYTKVAPSGPESTGLVFSVRNTEFPVADSTTVRFEQPNTYILDNGERYIVKIELEMPRNGSHEILDNIIRRHTDRGNSFPGTPASSGTTTPDLLPSDFKNQLVLMDEATGKVLGPLSQNVPISGGQSIDTSNDKPGQTTSDEAVVVSFYGDQEGDHAGQPVQVSPFDDLTRDFGKSNSKILGAAEYVSKGILFAAEYGANSVSGAASNYVKTTKATDSPLVFSDTTKASVAKVASATESAAKFSRKTVGFIGNKVEQFGGAAVRYGSKELENLGLIENDPAKKKARDPNSGIGGLFKNSVRAALLLAEGVEKGGKHFLETSRTSTNTVVGHRYGDQARDLTDSITSAGSNVVLVYVDARGVMHRALLKRVGKGAIRAQMQDGRQVVLDDPGMENQHTERDEKGNLIVVDDENDKQINLGGGEGYSTALETSDKSQSALLQRQPPARPGPPPVPPRY